MTMAKKILGAALGDGDDDSKLYVDDVFSTYLYTGKNSAQAINNGIDLKGEGGMVWIKIRNHTTVHYLNDSVRGTGYILHMSGAEQQLNNTWKITFTSNGYTDNLGWSPVQDIVSWTFRKALKFFDVVAYTGNGVAGRTISHNLGIAPGMITTKSTSWSGDWNTYHRSATGDLILNTTAVQAASRTLITAADVDTFTVSGAANDNGVQYIAYLFAHEPSANGIIQCGSYTGNGSATGPIVNLGWEPQYLMIKSTVSGGNWQIIDSMRGMPVGSADATLQANLTNAESSADYVSPTATGFQITSTSSEVNTSGSTYIYMAIRRPNKPPTTGTEVYNAIARTGTGAATTVTGVGFAPDLLIASARNVIANGNGGSTVSIDKLRGGGALLQCGYSVAEVSGLTDQITSFDVGGVTLGADTTYGRVNYSTLNYINHFFKRAPGFFDVVCYTGDGQGLRNINHGLGVVPTFAFIKERDGTAGWTVKLPSSGGATSTLMALNSSTGSTISFGNPSTATTFEVHSSYTTGNQNAQSNNINKKYVAYLFASCPGVSKVGSYTGNGASQTIDCGFTTGARFILIKRTDSTGDWYVWDTARGIVSSNDPHLSLNTTAAEVTTDDSVDPEASGFIVNQVAATAINVFGGKYIFLAIA